MHSLLNQRLAAALLVGTLLLLILAADTWTQLGFAHGVLYVPLLLLTIRCKHPGFLWPLVVITLIFTWLGFFISPAAPEGFPLMYVLANRFLATAAIMATGGLLAYLRKAELQRFQQQRLMDEQLERLNSILGSIADGFATLDEELRFTYVNEMASLVLGQPEEELLGQAFEEHPVVQQGQATIRAARHVIKSGQPQQIEDNTDNGNCYSLSIYPFQDGLSIYFRDITEQHQAEKELKLLRAAAARLNDVIIITEAEPMTDPGPRIVFVNEAFERITGYSKEEVIGQSPRLLQGPGTQRGEARRIGSAMRKWQSVRGELLNYKKNGDAFWFELDIVPLADETGWFTHWVAVERDITEKKELQQQLQHSQRMESIGQLTGGIAHDFNNLLTVISGNLDLLVEQLEKEPSLQTLAKTSARAADRGAQLTRSLLTFARKQMLQPTAININLLLQEMLPLLNSSVGEPIDLHLTPEENLWTALIDESYLESCLLNLVLNARDASPQGGVVLLETQNVTLDESYAARHADVLPGDYVMLAVSDNGTGIPAEIINRLFEPFFTTKEKARGTGLGLSMVFGFIKQSGGHISVESKLGQGSSFRLYLPKATEHKNNQQAEQVVSKTQPGRKTLLVVEDNDMVREFAVIQLQEAGYQVLEAETGEQALQMLESGQTLDLLFTDIIMPGQLNGLQLAEKAIQLYPQLPIVFTSGYTANALSQSFAKQLPAKILHKPYRRQSLLEAITEGLKSYSDVPNR